MTVYFHSAMALYIKILIFVDMERYTAQILHFIIFSKYHLCSNWRISSLVMSILPFSPISEDLYYYQFCSISLLTVRMAKTDTQKILTL